MFRTAVLIATTLVASSASAFWGNNYNNGWDQKYGDRAGSGNGTGAFNSNFNFNMTAKADTNIQNNAVHSVNANNKSYSGYRSHARSPYGYANRQPLLSKQTEEKASEKPQVKSESTRPFFKSVSFEERLAERDEMIKAIEARRAEQRQAMQSHREEVRRQMKVHRDESQKYFKFRNESVSKDT